MTDDTINIIIPVTPRTKKNGSRIVRCGKFTKLLPSEAYEEMEKECSVYLMNYNYKINYPINLKCIFYRDKNYKSDLVGYIQAIQDILVKYNVIADDNHNIVASLDGSRVDLDRQKPRVEIEIKEL